MRRGGMGRSNWLIVLLVIAGFYVVEHQRVPTVSVPAHYTMVHGDMRIPVAMAQAKSNQTGWALARSSQGYYVALMYQNGRLSRQFETTKKAVAQSGSGQTNVSHTYPATGQVNIAGTVYDVAEIHVNAAGNSGYIELKPSGNPAANNASSGSAVSNAAGNSSTP